MAEYSGKWEEVILNMIKTSEGGYVDHPADKGGPTNWGITLQSFSQYKKSSATVDELKSLPIEGAVEFYYSRYVDGTGLSNLDPLLQELALDTVVNHGAFAGVKMLQRAVGVVEDGKCGPKTISIVNSNPRAAYYGLIGIRMKKYAGIVNSDMTQLVFLAGWINRLARFMKPI